MLQLIANLDYIELWEASKATLLMLSMALILIVLLGLPLGVAIYSFANSRIRKHPFFYHILSFCINIIRSIPFIILMILLMPLTAFITGTTIDVAGVIPPITVAGIAFFARLTETALHEVDSGVIEAAQSMGAGYWQIVTGVLLPEARAPIIAAITVTGIALVDYTAVSGVIGGGGLGDLAIRYGYQRYETEIMLVTVLLLIVIVQVIQLIGNKTVHYFSKNYT
ncbi:MULTISPECIES: methionine ABC transporter permease [unclassified Acinetobacter]|uniref:methionine ABC transporter permease n=1 Tax=unclassified Acinetobacter TaxID=196816 RepID=UPI002934C431|nr:MULTISPECIES: methionine ABC transporter permease [unclassified Acinetobacter]WOE32475.1 methionine ABC transporter permease [Acinetobacter sp. SAAs470]WOE37951.1 methionine ABC transporter permease [Acinetobacter sp. SAAs474]